MRRFKTYEEMPQEIIDDVIRMKSDGMTNKKIMRELGISKNAIYYIAKTHPDVECLHRGRGDAVLTKERVDSLLSEGKTVEEVADLLGFTVPYVHSIKSNKYAMHGNAEWKALKNEPVPSNIDLEMFTNRSLIMLCQAEITQFRTEVQTLYNHMGENGRMAALRLANSEMMALFSLGQEDALVDWVNKYFNERNRNGGKEKKKKRGRKKGGR